ncbi:MAG: hypothetical protein ACPG8W_17970 [Candidatus Promineifilaceae bacterium]
MEIITKEHLLDTFMQHLHENMTEEREFSERQFDTLDEWAWNNEEALGRIVYMMIGDHYGDFDSIIE